MTTFEIEDRGYETACWIWQRALGANGYGYVWDPQTKKTVLAHRLAYELANGPIPDGLYTDHLCCIPACVNPDHLEIVSNAENIRRGKSTLTAEDARAIRAATEPVKSIAAKYGISSSNVSNIRAGRRWREDVDANV